MSTADSKIGARGSESRTKTGENVCFLSTGSSKFGARGTKSRQKTGEMPLFCLPDPPNPGRAEPKVDKNQGKCVFFVYRTLQIRGARNQK